MVVDLGLCGNSSRLRVAIGEEKFREDVAQEDKAKGPERQPLTLPKSGEVPRSDEAHGILRYIG